MLAANSKLVALGTQLATTSVTGATKLSCTYNNPQSAQKQLGALQTQSKLAWITNTPDGSYHVFWMTN